MVLGANEWGHLPAEGKGESASAMPATKAAKNAADGTPTRVSGMGDGQRHSDQQGPPEHLPHPRYLAPKCSLAN
jgi:hypothetical protein